MLRWVGTDSNKQVDREMYMYIWMYSPNGIYLLKSVFTLTCLNFNLLLSTHPLMQDTYRDIFSMAQNKFWIRRFWCLLVLLPFFCFSSSVWAKRFPLRIFFIWVNKPKKKNCLERDWVNREGGAWGHSIFRQKLLNTLHGVAGALRNHPSWNGQTGWKSSKKIHCSWTQPLTTTPAGFLGYPPTEGSKPVLQGACPPENNSVLFFWSPPIHACLYIIIFVLFSML